MKHYLRWRWVLRPQVGNYWTEEGTFDQESWNRDFFYWRNMKPNYNPWPVICAILIVMSAFLFLLLVGPSDSSI